MRELSPTMILKRARIDTERALSPLFCRTSSTDVAMIYDFSIYYTDVLHIASAIDLLRRHIPFICAGPAEDVIRAPYILLEFTPREASRSMNADMV